MGAIIFAFYALIALIGYASVTTFTDFNTALNEQTGQHGAQAVGLVVYITMGILLLIASFYIGIAAALIHGARTVRIKFKYKTLTLNNLFRVAQVF